MPDLLASDRLSSDLDQLHLWTVAAHIVLVYVQNGCITLNGILNTVNIKVKLGRSSGRIASGISSCRSRHFRDRSLVLAVTG